MQYKYNYEPRELSMEEVPTEIITELNSNYKHVTFELDSNMVPGVTRSYKTQYREPLFDGVPQRTVISDQNTFEPIGVIAYIHRGFVVRCDVDNDSVIVRRVVSYDTVGEIVETLGKLEPILDEQ